MTTGYKFKDVDLGYFLDLSRTGSNYFTESGANLTPISTAAVGTLTDVEKINVGIGYKINGVDIKNVSKAKTQLFETAGNFVLNAETYGDVKFRALIVGGGGGGGGGGGNIGNENDGEGGNGGGSGGALISNYMTVHESLSLTVGAAGAGGTRGGDGPSSTGGNSGLQGASGGATFIGNGNWEIKAEQGGGGGPGGTDNSSIIGTAGRAFFFSNTPATTPTRALYTQFGISGGTPPGQDGGAGYVAGDLVLKSSYSTTFPASKSAGAFGGSNNGDTNPAPSGSFGGGGGGGGGSNQGRQPSKGGNGGAGYAILWFYPKDQT
jgi:hypothetical protein